MVTNLKNLANSYFKLWKSQDFEGLRSLFSEEITFIGVLGKANGVDECLQGLRGLSNMITDIVIQHMWADEEDVITWYELHTTKTEHPLPVVNWSHVENNKITKIQVIFDPRPLLGD